MSGRKRQEIVDIISVINGIAFSQSRSMPNDIVVEMSSNAVSPAGDRARARIRRNRREFELFAPSGALGTVKVAREETIEEFAEMIGCTVEDVIASEMAAREARNDADDRDETLWNPPAGASWVDDRTTPLRSIPS